jgi:hypothetical protein
MKESIAKGELDAEHSYVTIWDADAERVEVIAGRWTEDEWKSGADRELEGEHSDGGISENHACDPEFPF